jgi:DtxR family Mn-dependent transcriptional regulator
LEFDLDVTPAIEDYLEAILRLEVERGVVRVKDLSGRLGVANASISSIMPKLGRLGLIDYERYGPIRLTPRGRRMAREVIRREEVLVKFFRDVLGIPELNARQEACRLEHEISQHSLERLQAFMTFLKGRPWTLKEWPYGLADNACPPEPSSGGRELD